MPRPRAVAAVCAARVEGPICRRPVELVMAPSVSAWVMWRPLSVIRIRYHLSEACEDDKARRSCEATVGCVAEHELSEPTKY